MIAPNIWDDPPRWRRRRLGLPRVDVMGFRFFRRVRIAPGFRLNLSKRGVSLSAGERGHWFTVSPSRTRTTVGLPRTE